jgi:hypothetical protein
LKVGLLPLFIPSQALENPQALDFGRLSFFSSILLSELKGYLKEKLPEIVCETFLTLPEILKAPPDIVLILSNSEQFGEVSDWAEQLKATLSCPVWLAGSHISYAPQTLPDTIDLGILGEIEAPIYQLLKLALQAGGAAFLTPQMYRKVPGVIYQSHGRMYSGSPAQEIPDLKRMPTPDLTALSKLPNYFAVSIRTSRMNDSLFSLLAFPPTRKPRLYSVDYICENMVSVVHHYQRALAPYGLPPELFRQVCSIFVTDYQFVLQKKRLEEIVAKMKSLYLHHVCFLTVHMPVKAVSEDLLRLLKSVNLQKVVLSFGPFGHQEPSLPPCNAQDLDRALALLQRFRIGVIGHFFVNPDAKVERQSIFRTYVYLQSNSMRFESFSCTVLGATPGLSLWEAAAPLRKQKYASDLRHYPWSSLNWGKPSPGLPVAQKHLTVSFFQEVYKACGELNERTAPFVTPTHQQARLKTHAEMVKKFAETYLFPEARLLELVLDAELALKPFLAGYHDVYQLWVSNGELSGTLPQPVDVLVASASLHGLRHPRKALSHALLALKPGGMVYVSILNPMFIGFLGQVFNWPERQSIASYKVLKWYTDITLSHLLDDCGLEVVELDYTMGNMEQLRETVEKLSKQFEHFASRRIPQHALYVREINILARKRKNA